MIRIRFLITFIFPKIDVKWHQSATFLNCPPKYPDFGSRSSATINEYATPYVTLHAFPKVKKPSIFTYRKACHYQVISDLPQKSKGIWSCVLTYVYLESAIEHVGLIQICFWQVATVSCVSVKWSTCFGSMYNFLECTLYELHMYTVLYVFATTALLLAFSTVWNF